MRKGVYTTELFIERATKTHNGFYSYELVEYVAAKKLVKITCPTHGVFEQSPDNHLQGKGCVKCSRPVQNLNDFIELATKDHNGKYTYEKSIFLSAKDKLEITCPNHGSFWQTPNAHRRFGEPQGCPKCAGNDRYGLEGFLIRAAKKHGNLYNYTLVNYKNNSTKVIIICRKHGQFKQSPDQHYSGNGCPKCSKEGSSYKELEWLKYCGVPDDNCHRQVPILINKKKRFFVDGKIGNTIYEFNGDFWHGNPKYYDADLINDQNKKSFGELYSSTLEKENILKSMGFDVISIWESDWDFECGREFRVRNKKKDKNEPKIKSVSGGREGNENENSAGANPSSSCASEE